MRLNRALIVAVALPVFGGVASTAAAAETPAESPAQDNGRSACLADFDGSGRVDFADFVAFAGVFGTTAGDANYNARGDLDNDGKVAFADFVAFAGVFGMPCVSVPASEDRKALVALYNATDGPNWSSNTNWLSNRPLDEWVGVTTDDSGHVTILELSRARLTGAIPPELGNLTNLKYVNLSWNELTGPIPRELGSLSNLTELNLGWNELTGPIPSWLGSLSNLTNLRLNANELTGGIPPELGSLSNLTSLYLGDNPLTGPVPRELGSLSNLIVLNLSPNRLTSAIPPELGNLSNLTYLNLGENRLTGPIPRELGSLSNLIVLNLSWNELTGAIPPELGSLTNLTSLYLGVNPLTGPIPPELGSLTNLTELNLGENRLTGPIPRELGSLSNLIVLNLSWNELTGAIPPELGSLSNLTSLYLGRNLLTGPVPSWLGGLTNLTELNLRRNLLTGPIPPELGSLTNLTRLNLGLNTITDIKALVGLTNLKRLDLEANPLNDESVNHHIPALKGRGVQVSFVAPVESDFDIELVFLDAFTEPEKRTLNYAARRWTWVITRDIPDVAFTGGWSDQCGGRSYEIPPGTRIDDLRIYVASHEGGYGVGWGGPRNLRDGSYLPAVGCMSFDLKKANLLITGLHEIGHVLGFGPIWNDLGLLRDPDGDIHFNGPLAIDAFDDAGGRNYTGAKVPLSDAAHWRVPLMVGEMMGPGGGEALSAITVQSMADIGYGVNVATADAYTLPAEAVGARELDFWRDRRQARLATPAEPAFTCGAGRRWEPVYVIDRQGRVVRTGDR